MSWCKAPQLLRGSRYYGSSLGSSNVSTDIKSEHCRCFVVLPHAILPWWIRKPLRYLQILPHLHFTSAVLPVQTSRVDTVESVLLSLSSAPPPPPLGKRWWYFSLLESVACFGVVFSRKLQSGMLPRHTIPRCFDYV